MSLTSISINYLKNDVKPLLSLAIPLAFTGLLQSSVYFFETLFLAHLGTDALAAGALVSWLFGTFAVILIGTLSAINIVVAHKYGANQHKDICLVVKDGIRLAVVLAVPSILVFWNLSPIFLWLGQSPSVVKLATIYLHSLTWGILPNMLLFALLEFIVGLGHARVLLVFSLLSVTLSTLLSFVLVFGTLGFPALGIAGAGWGISFSYFICLLCLVLYIAMNKEYKPYFNKFTEPTKASYLFDIAKIGLPMGLMYCVEVGYFFALTVVMGIIGSEVLAANQITMQYLGSLMAIIFSIAQAVTVRMGHLLGAGDLNSARKAAYIGTYLSALLMSVVAVFYWTIPDILISIDFNVNDPKNFTIVNLTKQLLIIGALFQIFEAVRISLFGALRALKDTRFTLFTSVISFWVIGFPLGYFIAINLKFGGTGLWLGMTIGAICSVFLLLVRLRSKLN